MNIGDKVVCVDFSTNKYWERKPNLLPNLVYVVSGVIEGYDDNALWSVGITLFGTDSSPSEAWNAKRFRKLDELKQLATLKQELQTK